MRRLVVAIVVLGAVQVAAAEPKGALGVPAGGQEATLRSAWKSWMRAAKWTEAPGPSAAAVKACIDGGATCSQLAALAVDRTWILSLSTQGEPILVGRVYDGTGALITTSERPCTKCGSNRGALTIEVEKLLDGLRDSVDRLNTKLVIEVEAPGIELAVDGAPVEIARPGLPIEQVVAAGPHAVAVTGGCWTMEPNPLPVTVESGATARVKLPVTEVAPRLRIEAGRDGAKVKVDGVEVGVTGADGVLEVATTRGPHHLDVERRGVRRHAEVTVDGCAAQTVPFVLAAPPTRSRGPIPYLIGAGGVVSLGVGIGLIVAHREPVNDSNRDLTYRDSKPFGYAFLGVGVAALGTAAVWWYLATPSAESAPATAPAVTLTPTGAAFGVSGRF